MNNVLKVLTATSIIIFALEEPGIPQSSEEFISLTKEIEQLKEGQNSIQKELREIKSLLSNRTAGSEIEATDVVLNVNNAPFKGNVNAKLVIIEFSDYACLNLLATTTQKHPARKLRYLRHLAICFRKGLFRFPILVAYLPGPLTVFSPAGGLAFRRAVAREGTC
jgi:hypothetical protein